MNLINSPHALVSAVAEVTLVAEVALVMEIVYSHFNPFLPVLQPPTALLFPVGSVLLLVLLATTVS